MNKVGNKKLVIFGAYGGANIGDEVILHAALFLARSRGFDGGDIRVLTIVRSTLEKDQDANDYAGLDVRWAYIGNFLSAFKLLWGCNLFIGGGQIIDGAYGYKLPLMQLVAAFICRVSGGRVIVGGAGVYSVDTKAVKSLYSCLFSLCHEVVVRDDSSYEMLQYESTRRENIRTASDIVFSLRGELNVKSEKKHVAFAIHKAPHLSLLNFDVAVKIATNLKEEYGDDFVVVVHDNRPEFDLDFAKRLVEKVSKITGGSLIPVKVFSNVEECLAFYCETRIIVSSRMHPLIIGSLAGCECLPLQGSSKVDEFARLAGLTVADPAELSGDTDVESYAKVVDAGKLEELHRSSLTLFDGFSSRGKGDV